MTSPHQLISSVAKSCLLAGVFCFLNALWAQAQETFLQSYWVINVATPAASIWAGGNESSGKTNDSPHAGGICLAESAIGQITAQSAGDPNAAANLAAAGNSIRTAGNFYRYTQVGPNLISTPAVSWNVVFPGGFNPANGSNYNTSATSTYISSDIAQADYILRARLEVNPADADAAQQLVLLVNDQMLPLEWSGTEAMAYSTYARLNGFTQNGTNTETLDVEQARGYFQGACNVLGQFLNNPFNAAVVEGQNPLVSSAVTNQVSQILDDYLRDLYAYAEASLTDFQLRQRANFYDPTVTGSTPSQPLLNDIDATVSEIQMRLLLASPFQNLPVYTQGSIGQTTSILHDLRRLHQSVVLGRITFNTGASGDPTGDPTLDYGEFTTAFVPFFNGQANPGNSSFDVALNLANTFTTYAVSQETLENSDIQTVLQRQYDWASQQNTLQDQYLTQLQNLCGYVEDADGNSFPDIFTAILPPASRDAIVTQISTNGLQFDETGTIYQQWQAVQTAETNLLLASIQLTNTFATIVEDAQIGNAIYSNQVQFAEVITSDGHQISAIDQQEGQVQAQAALATAQVNAATAEDNANNAILGLGLSYLFPAASFGASGPSVSVPSPGPTVAAVANDYDQASADLQIGSIQANTDTQIADLYAQIQQINSSEQAQAQYLQANTTMMNLSAQLNSLRLQANAQEVQIQLAAQQVDQEKSKLANKMAQVSSLLNQWMRSSSLISQNPAFSSDLLLTRDATITPFIFPRSKATIL